MLKDLLGPVMTVKKKKIIPEDRRAGGAGSKGGCAVVPLDVLLAREGRMRRDGGEGFAGLLEPH